MRSFKSKAAFQGEDFTEVFKRCKIIQIFLPTILFHSPIKQIYSEKHHLSALIFGLLLIYKNKGHGKLHQKKSFR